MTARFFSRLTFWSALIHQGGIANSGEQFMLTQFFQKYRNTFAGIGAVILSPAAFLVTFGLMNASGFDAPNNWLENLLATNATAKTLFGLFLHPVVVLGGIVLTLAMNSLPLLHIRFQPEESSISATITVKERFRNAILAAFSLFLLGSVLMYAFFENFRIEPR